MFRPFSLSSFSTDKAETGYEKISSGILRNDIGIFDVHISYNGQTSVILHHS